MIECPSNGEPSGIPKDFDRNVRAGGWSVLLDAAAFVPTSRLDLRAVQADFVAVSFYKMFGYPTGVGCLLARRKALKKLHRPWFSGGTITVGLDADGEAANLRVTDTGIGIAEQDLPHIFERSYRADTSRHAGGTGLGLAIARWIVEQHGGIISAVSAPGKGSIFTVRLPLHGGNDPADVSVAAESGVGA